MRLPTIVPLFCAADAEQAYHAWGCNCGPSALAAVCGVDLETSRRVLPGFEEKRYTNPSMMFAGLRSLKEAGCIAAFDVTIGARKSVSWPLFGLARVQWEGPWTAPGVPMAARYRRTHWVGVQKDPTQDDYAIFDVNAMATGGVVTAESWTSVVVPWILEQCVPKADGRWHLTHSIEVRRSVRTAA